MAAAAAASSVLFGNAWAWIAAPVTLGRAAYVTANVVSGAVLELAHVAAPPDVVGGRGPPVVAAEARRGDAVVVATAAAAATAGVLLMAEAAFVAAIAHSPSEVYAATGGGIAYPGPQTRSHATLRVCVVRAEHVAARVVHVHGNTDMYTSLEQKVALANDSFSLLWRRKGGERNPPPRRC